MNKIDTGKRIIGFAFFRKNDKKKKACGGGGGGAGWGSFTVLRIYKSKS